MQEEIIPQLQLYPDVHPELLNPDWIHWKATKMSSDGKTAVSKDDGLYLSAARVGGYELAQKLMGDDWSPEKKLKVSWQLFPFSELNGVYGVKVLGIGALPPSVKDLIDPRRISDEYVAYIRDQLKLMANMGGVKLTNKDSAELAIRERCKLDYYNDVFGIVFKSDVDNVKALYSWADDPDDWQLQHIKRKDRVSDRFAIPLRSAGIGGKTLAIMDIYEPEPPMISPYTGKLTETWLVWFMQHTNTNLTEAVVHAARQLEAFGIVLTNAYTRLSSAITESGADEAKLNDYVSGTFRQVYTTNK